MATGKLPLAWECSGLDKTKASPYTSPLGSCQTGKRAKKQKTQPQLFENNGFFAPSALEPALGVWATIFMDTINLESEGQGGQFKIQQHSLIAVGHQKCITVSVTASFFNKLPINS